MRAVEVKLLKLRIDTISKGGRNTCCCLLILAWFLASLLFVNLLPSPTASPLSEDCTNLTNGERRGRFCNKHLLNGLSVFETYFMDIDPFSQFLLLTAKPRKAPVSERIKLTKTVQFTTLIEQIGEDFLVTKSLGVLADNEAKVECDFLDSAAEFCSQFTLFLEPQLRPGNYKISFQIYNREDIIEHISQLELEATRHQLELLQNSDPCPHHLFCNHYSGACHVFYKHLPDSGAAEGLRTELCPVPAFLVGSLQRPILGDQRAVPLKVHALPVNNLECLLSGSPPALLGGNVPGKPISSKRAYSENDSVACNTMQWWKLLYIAVPAR
jgi:hypothetical protein